MLDNDRADPELWKRYDWEFHHALISACGSQVLMETHASIYDRYLRYQMVAVIFRGEIAAQEHQILLDCAVRRDAIAGATAVLTTSCRGLRRAHACRPQACSLERNQLRKRTKRPGNRPPRCRSHRPRSARAVTGPELSRAGTSPNSRCSPWMRRTVPVIER
jgi:hypothetical protein